MPHADTHPDVSFIQTTLHPDGCRLQNAERMVRRMRVQSVLLVPVSVVIYKKCLKCFSLDSLIIFLNNSEKSIKVNNFGTQHPEETRHQRKNINVPTSPINSCRTTLRSTKQRLLNYIQHWCWLNSYFFYSVRHFKTENVALCYLTS